MQKIFYNAKFKAENGSQTPCEAFFVNDGKFVLIGPNDEVLQMKQDGVEEVDLEGRYVYPTFFDTNASIYQMIENNLKTANLTEFLENNEEIDENYEKFVNYDKYKQEFLKIQDEYISKGVTTIQEIDVGSKEFTFWKKISEEKLLVLDIIAYINFVTNKAVMDNNCRSFRKYRYHFRIGGYYIKLDGKILTSSAWISKPYRGTKDFKGYGHIFDEQLGIIIKTCYEEKKQLFVEANGDNAIEQFLRVFEEVKEKEKPEDLLRPILHSPTQLMKKHIAKIKEYGITPSLDFESFEKDYKTYKNMLGAIRRRRMMPLKMLYKNNINYINHSANLAVPDIGQILEVLKNNKFIKKQIQSSRQTLEGLYYDLLKTTSYITFDNELKSSFEEGKLANFIVLKDGADISNFDIEEVYLEAEPQIKKG